MILCIYILKLNKVTTSVRKKGKCNKVLIDLDTSFTFTVKIIEI